MTSAGDRRRQAARWLEATATAGHPSSAWKTGERSGARRLVGKKTPAERRREDSSRSRLTGETTSEKYDALRTYLDTTLRADVERGVKMRGIEFTFELESESAVESDGKASLTLVLTPTQAPSPSTSQSTRSARSSRGQSAS